MSPDSSPIYFETCNSFVLAPEKACLNRPRSNTWVTAYVSGDSARCSWTKAGSQSYECDCHSDAKLDQVTGDCVCDTAFFGNGLWFCHPQNIPKWYEMAMQNTPRAREGHSFVLVQNAMWLFGGTSSEGEIFLGDLHSMLTYSYTWQMYQEVAADFGGPCPRAQHAATAWQSYLFIHGGRNSTHVFSDLFMLDVVASPAPLWTDLSALDNAPSPRSHHVAAVAEKEGNAFLYIFGGLSNVGSLLADMFEMDITALKWRNLGSPAGSPPACKQSTLVHFCVYYIYIYIYIYIHTYIYIYIWCIYHMHSLCLSWYSLQKSLYLCCSICIFYHTFVIITVSIFHLLLILLLHTKYGHCYAIHMYIYIYIHIYIYMTWCI